jgi:hypothetical protein
MPYGTPKFLEKEHPKLGTDSKHSLNSHILKKTKKGYLVIHDKDTSGIYSAMRIQHYFCICGNKRGFIT